MISKLQLINECIHDIHMQITHLQAEIKRHEKYREEDWMKGKVK